MKCEVVTLRLMTANNITIGIDLGDRRHAVCVLSAAGEILAEEAITNTRECLTAFAARHPGLQKGSGLICCGRAEVTRAPTGFNVIW